MVLGSIFLRKYYFVFEQKTRTIGFYNMNTNQKKMKEEKPKWNMGYRIILYIIYGIVLIFIGFLIAKQYYKKNKKKANELDENHIKGKNDNYTNQSNLIDPIND